ncbi:MAG: efflux RND transporter permease subunit [bacterium]
MIKFGPAGRIGQFFINSKLTPIIVIVTLLLGVFAVLKTTREEEPQITVPFADVIVPMPGTSAKEVEKRISMPLEKLIWEIGGVEYVYSMSRPNMSIVTVRFLVGQNQEASLVKLYDKVMGNMDMLPPGALQPIVKSKSIDDVPVLTLTVWSKKYQWGDLRHVAGQLADEIKKVNNVSDVQITGGQRRQMKVIPGAARMAARNISLPAIAGALMQNNTRLPSGVYESGNREYIVESGEFLESEKDISGIIVGTNSGRPVYLRDVADIVDGPEELKDYVFMVAGPAGEKRGINAAPGQEYAAVNISVAKRKGSDASHVVENVLEHIGKVRSQFVPSEINITETRNYGATAKDKVNELIKHLGGAILAVTLVILIAMGWRSALVILISIPITFSLTLFIYYINGYTLNRITLFALVFVTGIVVDDSIIVVENIHRHFSMRQLPPYQAAITAVNEVGNPTILATFTVIAAVFPMYFVTGLMGPYMRPMPVGSSLAMLISLLVAFIVAPYLAFRLMKHTGAHGEEDYSLEKTATYRIYVRIMRPLIERPFAKWIFLTALFALLLGSISLLFTRSVTVKMLPFDNKSEFQIIVNMPEGTPLEQTAMVSREIGKQLGKVPEVTDYQLYIGRGAPINFNGLVRHYYMRQGGYLADIQVNLTEKGERKADSHKIALRVRNLVQPVADKYGARVKIAEVPPGPPVMSTLVAEIYGPDIDRQTEIAREVKNIFKKTDGVVDIDWMVEDDQPKQTFIVDKQKAMLSGVSPDQVVKTMSIALAGMDVGLAHITGEYDPVTINVRLPRDQRSSLQNLREIYAQSATGKMIPISELVTYKQGIEDKTIYRKNLKRVVYVTGDVAGHLESPVYAMLDISKKLKDLKLPQGYSLTEFYSSQPPLEENFGLKWDGEWQITYEVFRDLGIAFMIVLILIYVLIVAWFQSFTKPLVMMIAIPLTLVGILPGHWLLHSFFTATSMIGFIALSGIIVRNSILLIDFAQMRLAEGMPLKQAVLDSGAVRFRPIALTSGAVVVGAIPIYLDPIFQGLAVALMGGAIASTILTLLVVPLVFYMVESIGKRKGDEIAGDAAQVDAVK